MPTWFYSSRLKCDQIFTEWSLKEWIPVRERRTDPAPPKTTLVTQPLHGETLQRRAAESRAGRVGVWHFWLEPQCFGRLSKWLLIEWVSSVRQRSVIARGADATHGRTSTASSARRRARGARISGSLGICETDLLERSAFTEQHLAPITPSQSTTTTAIRTASSIDQYLTIVTFTHRRTTSNGTTMRPCWNSTGSHQKVRRMRAKWRQNVWKAERRERRTASRSTSAFEQVPDVASSNVGRFYLTTSAHKRPTHAQSTLRTTRASDWAFTTVATLLSQTLRHGFNRRSLC